MQGESGMNQGGYLLDYVLSIWISNKGGYLTRYHFAINEVCVLQGALQMRVGNLWGTTVVYKLALGLGNFLGTCGGFNLELRFSIWYFWAHGPCHGL